MKTILFCLITSLITSASFAADSIIKIEESESKLARLEVAKMPVNARLVFTPFSPGSVYKKMTIDVDVTLEWNGCGWFGEGAKILLLEKPIFATDSVYLGKDISFLVLTDGMPYACSGLESDKRVFTYSFFPIESEILKMSENVKVQTFFKPNPKGPKFREIFDRVEVTQPDGTVTTVKP